MDAATVFLSRAITFVLVGLLVSLLLERSLSFVTDARFYRDRLQRFLPKRLLAGGSCIVIAFTFQIDLLAILFAVDATGAGCFVSALAFAGGSKWFYEMFARLADVSDQMGAIDVNK